MFDKIDLKKLSHITAPDRAFVSIYLNSPASLSSMKKRIKQTETILTENKDELTYFQENIKAINNYLELHPFTSRSLCIFSSWVLDYLEAYPLNMPVADLLWIDSSPYIRPLAELQDEYENFVVVAADNSGAKIFLLTSAVITSEEHLRGNIKNHVRKGGWSQQRYERRRDKQLFEYGKEICEKIMDLDKKEAFRRILLVGGKEIILEIKNRMPPYLMKKLVGEKNLDLGKDERIINKEIFDLFFIEERKSEKELWKRIKTEFMQSGLGALGHPWVLKEAKAGNIEKLIVNKNAKIDGMRCRNCDYLSGKIYEFCPGCESTSVFKVDLVNEIIEICAITGADVDFVTDIPVLSKIGDMAALLRYKI